MITRSRKYLNAQGMPPPELLRSVLREHRAELPRLEKLRRYYCGQNDILKRERASGLPNNRLSHAYARYIVAVTTGYLLGAPVAYDAGDSATMDAVAAMFRRQSVAAVDAENARNAAIYGRGVELLHTGDDLDVRITPLCPTDAFVVYDDGCDAEPLFGVYCAPERRCDGTTCGMSVWVAGETMSAEYRMDDLDAALIPVCEAPHFFGGVPMIEYWNDETETGDFEWVLPQIDGYDKLQSDRINDKEQFVDALLVLVGCTLDTDDRGRSPGRQLREDKALCLPDSQANAYYLHNSMDESGNRILRNDLAEDIHKLSLAPDLSDESFSQNASGVAMRYKLWGLEQLTRIKEQWFTEGLRARLKLIAHYMQLRGAAPMDAGSVGIRMTRALPANLTELAENIRSARDCGAMSRETAVRTLHREEDWSEQRIGEEVERLIRETATQ